MKTDVLIYVRCGGETSTSINLMVSLEGMSLLQRLLKNRTMILAGLDRQLLKDLMELRLVDTNWYISSKMHTIISTASALTLVGELTAKAWSRSND